MEPIYHEAPFLYFATTDEGFLVDVNEMLCHQLGYGREELLGQKQDLIFTLPTRIFQQTHFFPLLKMHGHAEEIYITLQTRQKESLPVLINAVRKGNAGKAVTGHAGIVVHNRKKFEDELIAARKAAEKALSENTALQEAKQQLQQHAELLDQQMYLVHKQNEELRQFNHVVTHEMQEPLRKLFVFTSMLLESEGGDTNARTARKIKSVAEQMRNTLSGLQQYVWLLETPVSPRKMALGDLLASLLAKLKAEHPEVNIAVHMDVLPSLLGDTEQMSFLFLELLRNAVRFRKQEGAVNIHITANLLQLNKYRAMAERYEYTPYLKIEVKDDGAGFDSIYKEQAFALFKRLHANSGRGIGLSLCKKIVENHQGSISVDSQLGEGTVVTITLPQFDLSDAEKTPTNTQKTSLHYDEERKINHVR